MPTQHGSRTRSRRQLLLLAAACACVSTVAVGLFAAPRASPANIASRAQAPAFTSSARHAQQTQPVRIRIPSIAVDAPLRRLGLKTDRSLQVPPNAYTAGWFTGAPAPGQVGPAVIAAHVHWNGTDGAFARLSQLRAGDRIAVVQSQGSPLMFRVDRVEAFPKDRFPTKQVYGNLSYAGLRLITCDGFDARRHRYLANLVVFARLIT